MKPRIIESAHDFSIAVAEMVRKSRKSYRQIVAGTDVHFTKVHSVVSQNFVPKIDTALTVLDLFGMEMVIRKKRKRKDGEG